MSGSGAKGFGTAGLVLALVLGLLVLIGRGGAPQRLGPSPMGFDGLVPWLAAQDIAARSFGGGYTLHADAIALRILPLFDAAPDVARAAPRTREQVLTLNSERDLPWSVIEEKADAAPSLIILPKWRRGARLTGTAHPDLLIPDADLTSVVSRLLGRAARLTTDRQGGFSNHGLSVDGQSFDATLYAARVVSAPGCTSLLGPPEAAFLLECDSADSADSGTTKPFFVLSDPDLMNNHGLALGENARLATAVLTMLANQQDGRDIIIDYSSAFWTQTNAQSSAAPRSWADIRPLFAWPYALIWLGLGMLFALALWRGAVRYGAPIPPSEPAPLAPVAAEARLLRLSGEKGRLLSDYVDRRFAVLTQRLLGPRAPLSALERLLPRRAPRSGPPLLKMCADIRAQPAIMSSAAAQAQLHEFETLIDRVIDEFD